MAFRKCNRNAITERSSAWSVVGAPNDGRPASSASCPKFVPGFAAAPAGEGRVETQPLATLALGTSFLLVETRHRLHQYGWGSRIRASSAQAGSVSKQRQVDAGGQDLVAGGGRMQVIAAVDGR